MIQIFIVDTTWSLTGSSQRTDEFLKRGLHLGFLSIFLTWRRNATTFSRRVSGYFRSPSLSLNATGRRNSRWRTFHLTQCNVGSTALDTFPRIHRGGGGNVGWVATGHWPIAWMMIWRVPAINQHPELKGTDVTSETVKLQPTVHSIQKIILWC